MDTNIEEHKFLITVDEDFFKYGKTDKKCPRCGNDIILIKNGNSYSIRCKTEKCIKADFRGI